MKGALRLAAVDRVARRRGLAPGLTLADARARIPDLAVVEHDPVADAAFFEQVADDCDRWTPLVARDAADGLMLDITGCAHLFGGEAALRTRLLAHLHRHGLGAVGVIAGTPDAARALARAEERIGALDRARLIARATGLARDLAGGTGRDRG